jgi:hypothetical protein
MNYAHRTPSPPLIEHPACAAMEDLDAEPWAAPRRGRHLEPVLGLLLVLTVVVLGVGQFWVENVHHTAYQEGGRAVEAQDWATAQAAYAVASGYADAAQRATAAGQMVREVKALEQQAAAAIKRCDAPELAGVLRRLQEIAPHASATEQVRRMLAASPNWLLWCRPELTT